MPNTKHTDQTLPCVTKTTNHNSNVLAVTKLSHALQKPSTIIPIFLQLATYTHSPKTCTRYGRLLGPPLHFQPLGGVGNSLSGSINNCARRLPALKPNPPLHLPGSKRMQSWTMPVCMPMQYVLIVSISMSASSYPRHNGTGKTPQDVWLIKARRGGQPCTKTAMQQA